MKSLHLSNLIHLSIVAFLAATSGSREETREETRAPTRQEILVAATLILEAGGESDPRAMEAVNEVIVNRAENRDLLRGQVVLQPMQFSCWNDKERRVELLHHAMDHTKYDQALEIVTDEVTNHTHGATHYHADYVHPYWADSLTRTVKIETHIFYK
jgi:spore germination cell wall hydrolase CwlJ-like protein